jgi:hypothetical protein
MKNIFLFYTLIVYAFCTTFAQNAKPDVLSQWAAQPEYRNYSPFCDENGTIRKEYGGDKADFRSCKVNSVYLEKYGESLFKTEDFTFDDKTVWPEKLPTWLNLKKITEIGKTPGLNIKKLHKQGITGKGVSIAIIDQPLGKHKEYQNNLVFYKNPTNRLEEAAMHGSALTSIAVGKTVGVAPDAKLYYIVHKYQYTDGIFSAEPYAEAIEHLLDVNHYLPDDEKIVVIAISQGGFKDRFNSKPTGLERFSAALKKAKEQGIWVITTDDNVFTLSRKNYYANPDEIYSYTKPAHWFDDRDMKFYENSDKILVPTDYRILASPTGYEDYVAYGHGGLSWAVPYLAGVYALAKQVKHDLTPDLFMKTAYETAYSLSFEYNGKQYKAKYFINPEKLIGTLQINKETKNKTTKKSRRINK